jgi:hypothetical protein
VTHDSNPKELMMTKRRRAVSAALACLIGLPALALDAESASGPDPEAIGFCARCSTTWRPSGASA